MRFIALQHKSTETKIINISLAGTWPGHKARQVRRQEKNKKRIERAKKKKKKMWVHLVCNWEYRSRLRHPKRIFLCNLHQLKKFTDINTWQKVHTWLMHHQRMPTIYICVEIYTHPRISQSDFPVMHFVALQHKSTKMINNNFVDTIGI